MDEVRRTYLRDPQGTTTGGRFTRNPSGAQRAPLTYKGTQGDLGRKPSKPNPKAGKPVSASFQTLRVGADNDAAVVRDVQRLLGQLGIRSGGLQENGVYDDATAAAIKEAQRRLGIKNPNGHADRGLVNKLLAAYDLSPCIGR